jgi:iron complex transport system substrate-binding protein
LFTKHRVYLLFIIGCLLPGLLSSCVPRRDSSEAQDTQTPFSFTDGLGRRYAQRENLRRIVSLSPAVTEILFAIGAGDHVVGVTQYCDYPEEARKRTSVGGFSGATVSVEQIRVLDPDLVILSADMHARIVFLLDELNIPSFAVEPRNFSQVYETIILLGEITDHVAEAWDVVSQMKAKIAGVEEKIQANDAQGRQRPGVFWILGEDPLMTAGAETFVSEAISLGGGRNVFGDLREQWPLVSPEQVLLRRPGWILFGVMGNDAAETTAGSGAGGPLFLRSAFWQTIPAVREGRVAFINGDLLYRYGPRLADAVVVIAEILQ